MCGAGYRSGSVRPPGMGCAFTVNRRVCARKPRQRWCLVCAVLLCTFIVGTTYRAVRLRYALCLYQGLYIQFSPYDISEEIDKASGTD